jgi:hypothetical protein
VGKLGSEARIILNMTSNSVQTGFKRRIFDNMVLVIHSGSIK